MNEEQMREECAKIQTEWQMGGLAGTMYEDFAVELAKRVQAAERERCAKLLDTLTMVNDWAALAADMGDVLGQNIQIACAEALGPNAKLTGSQPT